MWHLIFNEGYTSSSGPGLHRVELLAEANEQDRSRWDRTAIAEGTALITQAMSRACPGPYQLRAAIAAVHAEADRAEHTDWAQIPALYTLLDRISANPVVTLNRAVATAMVHGPHVGLALLRQLAGDERLADAHRLDAVAATYWRWPANATRPSPTTAPRRAAPRASRKGTTSIREPLASPV